MGFFENSKYKQKKDAKNGKQARKNEFEKKIIPLEDEKTVQKPVKTSKTMDDINQEFQMMYDLPDDTSKTPPVIKHEPMEEKGSTDTTLSTEKGKESPKVVPPKLPFKPLTYKKLSIVLLENTKQVANEQEIIRQIINASVKSELVCLINYNHTALHTHILELSELNQIPLFLEDQLEEDGICLFDTLLKAEQIAERTYLITKERATERICIDKIEIIGIGTCRNVVSKASQEDALNSFFRVSLKSKVTTKYFCLTEAYYQNAAEIGFHSIGSISKVYQ